MNFQSRIKIKEHELIHGQGKNSGKNKTVYDVAEVCNKSYPYVCRISSLTEDVPFPVGMLVPAMKLKQNFDCLELIAWECGFAIIPLPKKVKMQKGDVNQMAATYQKTSSDAVQALLDVIDNLNPDTYKKFEDQFKQMVQNTLSVKKTIDKKASKQLELEF